MPMATFQKFLMGFNACTQGLRNISRAVIYRAHRVVIFAIARFLVDTVIRSAVQPFRNTDPM